MGEARGPWRIVVGVDGSAASVAALRWAAREAGLRGAEVRVVRAWDRSQGRRAPYAGPGRAPGPGVDRRSALVRLEVALHATLGHAPRVAVEAEVADGLAARVLLDRCAGADLLVLGGGNGPWEEVGPVARACLRRAPCPVVIVGAAPRGPAPP